MPALPGLATGPPQGDRQSLTASRGVGATRLQVTWMVPPSTTMRVTTCRLSAPLAGTHFAKPCMAR